MHNRARNDIIAEMLRPLLKKQVSRTKMMYYAMLSNEQSKSYMSFLLEKGLIVQSEPKHFSITDKGREFLHVIDEMNSMITIPAEEEKIVYPSDLELPVPWGTSVPGPSKSLKETARLVAEKIVTMKNGTSTKAKERQDVQTLWDSGMRSDTKMCKVLGLTRGVVYNHLRQLGLKPKKG